MWYNTGMENITTIHIMLALAAPFGFCVTWTFLSLRDEIKNLRKDWHSSDSVV